MICRDFKCSCSYTVNPFVQDNLRNRKFCPVGKLLPGVAVVIMNDELQPQPVGVAGEVSTLYRIVSD